MPIPLPVGPFSREDARVGAIGTGIVFLLAGAAVYAWNTEQHDGQLVIFGLGPDRTPALFLALGLLFVLKGAWARMQHDDGQDGDGGQG